MFALRSLPFAPPVAAFPVLVVGAAAYEFVGLFAAGVLIAAYTPR